MLRTNRNVIFNHDHNVAEYFKEFLACNNAIQARVETTSLVNALKKFSDEQEHTPSQRESFLDLEMALCERDSKTQKLMDFSSLANELCPDDPAPLNELLSDPELQLSDGFVADCRALRGLISLKKKRRIGLWSLIANQFIMGVLNTILRSAVLRYTMCRATSMKS